MVKLDYEELHARLLQRDKLLRLVNYIFETQGTELRRLNYKAAGNALHVSRASISNYCDELADLKIIIFRGDELKLNEEIIAAV